MRGRSQGPPPPGLEHARPLARYARPLAESEEKWVTRACPPCRGVGKVGHTPPMAKELGSWAHVPCLTCTGTGEVRVRKSPA